MKTIILLIIFSLASLSTPAYSNEVAAEVIQVEKAFSRASIPGMSMSAAFMTLKNTGKEDHLLVEAVSSLASSTELHGHVKVNDMMRMRQMQHVHIDAGKSKTLQPGGLHVMFIGLEKQLIQGETFKLKLIYEDGSEQMLTVPVKSISANQ